MQDVHTAQAEMDTHGPGGELKFASIADDSNPYWVVRTLAPHLGLLKGGQGARFQSLGGQLAGFAGGMAIGAGLGMPAGGGIGMAVGGVMGGVLGAAFSWF